MNARLTFVHALSPLHAGTGQGAGIIDLPIAREKATGLPFLPGSSLKGTLRACCKTPELCKQIFGPDTTEIQTDSNHTSSAQFSDQRLLLLPIRSLAGTFAWVTCPYVLRRLMRDIEDAQLPLPEANIPSIAEMESCAIVVADKEVESKITVEAKVYLEEFELNALPEGPKGEVNAWAKWLSECIFPQDEGWRQMLIERLCIVHDDLFNFMIDTATEITARIKLREDAKTVQEGGLWYEEALPTETILSGIVLATLVKKAGIMPDKVFEVLGELLGQTLQFGGKATVGRGMCKVQLAGETKQAVAEGGKGNANT